MTGTGANKMTPLHVGTSYTHDFRFYSKGNASGAHQSAWAGSLKHEIDTGDAHLLKTEVTVWLFLGKL